MKIKIDKILERCFFKEDIQDLLDEADLPVSGSKDELIERLLQKGGYTTREILESCDKEELQYICGDFLDLPASGTKSYLIDEIMSVIEKTPKKRVKTVQELGVVQEPEEIKMPQIPSERGFSDLISTIKKWIPLKRHKTEEGYQVDLRSHLSTCGYKTRLESGETMVDILVDNKYPVEIKKNPKQSEYDRLLGQLVRHYRAKKYAIAVICDVKRLEQIEDFKHNVSGLFEKNVEVILK